MILENVISFYNKKDTFKVIAFLILSLPAFQYGSQFQNLLVSIQTPNFTCQYNETSHQIQISKDQCTMTINGSNVKCQHWTFSSEPFGKTIMSDYDLVCDYKYVGDLLVLLWYSTSLMAPVFGWLADKYGRKMISIIFLSIETVATFILAFTPNLSSHIFFRLCIGFSESAYHICYVWLMEMVNKDFRNVAGSFFWLYGSVAMTVFPLTVYVTRNWRLTQLISLTPSILYVLILFVPESPRWLCVKNKKQQLMESLQTIANINKMDLQLTPEEIKIEKTTKESNKWNAFKDNNFLFLASTSLFAVFSISILISAILIDLNLLSSNIYISMFVLGLMEFPGALLSYLSMYFFKRKRMITIFSMFGSIFIFLSVTLSKVDKWQSIFRMIFGSIGKVLVITSSQGVLVYATELFPTTHRSLFFGMLQIILLMAMTAAVYINKLNQFYGFIPMLIYFLLNMISCCLIFVFMPETKGLPIPETIFDQRLLVKEREQEYLEYMYNRSDVVNSDREDSDASSEMSQLINRKFR
uniref:Slc22a-7 n=1 Tax=Schmidtea mediterranea TaxID=79327 RepID=A0A0H3YF34_SCHMD|nr:slc22a-7 [Schmidtea mediterranea]